MFFIYQCVNNTSTCIQIQELTTEGNVVIPYDPSECNGRCFLYLNVFGGEEESQFSFIYRAEGYRLKLDDDSVDIAFISMNEYIYYNLTLTDPSMADSITIKVVEYSGEVNLIGSRTLQNPTLSDALFSDEAEMNWNDMITYTSNLSQPIYLSVFGETEAAYKISVMVNRQENTPTIYVRLED